MAWRPRKKTFIQTVMVVAKVTVTSDSARFFGVCDRMSRHSRDQGGVAACWQERVGLEGLWSGSMKRESFNVKGSGFEVQSGVSGSGLGFGV